MSQEQVRMSIFCACERAVEKERLSADIRVETCTQIDRKKKVGNRHAHEHARTCPRDQAHIE